MLFDDIFYEIALLLAVAGAAAIVANWVRQPLIVAFIAVGILVGPAGVNWVHIGSEIELLSKIGIALLLFTVGLKLDVRIIRTLGLVSLATGLGQVLFTALVGFGICIVLGYSYVPAAYIAVGLTFSSTIIIVKLLSDKREIDSLHGRIAVGFLIVQDVVVVFVLIVLSAVGGDSVQTTWFREIAVTATKGGALLGTLYLAARYLFPMVSTRIAKSSELLTTFGICWAVSVAAMADWLGFNKEVGAFLAGVSLASMAYREVLSARLTALRDFLLLFFFVELGATLQLDHIASQLLPAIILSAFVLLGNPAIVLIIMGFMGFRKRTAFLAGLTVAQVSEFSLLLGAMGIAVGHINQEILGVITLTALITIAASTYMIVYSHVLYTLSAPLLSLFERSQPYREIALEKFPAANTSFDGIVFGMGRAGAAIARTLREQGMRILGVDFDPNLVRRLDRDGEPVIYGDAEDPEFVLTLPIPHVNLVISSIPVLDVNLTLIRTLHNAGFQGKIATTAHSFVDSSTLVDAGSDIVLFPHLDAAHDAGRRIAEALKRESTESETTSGD